MIFKYYKIFKKGTRVRDLDKNVEENFYSSQILQRRRRRGPGRPPKDPDGPKRRRERMKCMKCGKSFQKYENFEAHMRGHFGKKVRQNYNNHCTWHFTFLKFESFFSSK